jgi:hypothetical protein
MAGPQDASVGSKSTHLPQGVEEHHKIRGIRSKMTQQFHHKTLLENAFHDNIYD